MFKSAERFLSGTCRFVTVRIMQEIHMSIFIDHLSYHNYVNVENNNKFDQFLTILNLFGNEHGE